MIEFVYGAKGSGKTKKMIDMPMLRLVLQKAISCSSTTETNTE